MKQFARKLWIYQRERFPLVQYVPMVAAFSFCAVTYAARLGGRTWPGPFAYLLAFGVCLIFFLQLRIADEFKDAEEDAKWRPYRPVPRGLVKKRDLAVVFALGMAVQAVPTLAYHDKLLGVLIFAWAYLGAMTFEFGRRRWLKARPVVYLLSHMLIMPIVDFYATACEWMPRVGNPPPLLIFFLAGSFANGVVIEFGRKIRSADREEEGVETYTVLWGRRRAAFLWSLMVQITAVLGGAALLVRGAGSWGYASLAAGATVVLVTAWVFVVRPTAKRSKVVEAVSGLWTMLFYLTLGLS